MGEWMMGKGMLLHNLAGYEVVAYFFFKGVFGVDLT